MTSWVAGVRLSYDAVIVGVPTVVSRYLKLAVLVVSAIVTDVIDLLSRVSRNAPVPDVEVRLTTSSPVVVGLLKASSRWIVIVPDTPVVLMV